LQFTELALQELLQKGISDAGFVSCTPVQEQTLSASLQGKDVCAQSQTGTGKTAAFLITALQQILEKTIKRALIIVPTRELATQIEAEATVLAAHTDINVALCYGGVKFERQIESLRNGAQIIVGTPGRLIDFSGRSILDLQSIDLLILDEADRLFDMGFLPDIRRLLKAMPPVTQRQTMLFSATLDYRVRQLAWEHMLEPQTVEIEPESVAVEKITQRLYHVGSEEKIRLLVGLLRTEKPASAIIFTNMKFVAEEVAYRLRENGIEATYLSGDLAQNKRSRIVDQFKEGKIGTLVATDVAARGLHIDDLSIVINYDVPEHAENYVHRIGRTARAGKEGLAVTLACEQYVMGLEPIEKLIGMKIPVEPIADSLLGSDASSSMHLGQLRRKYSSGSPQRSSRGGGRSSGPRRGSQGSSGGSTRRHSAQGSTRGRRSQSQDRKKRSTQRTNHQPTNQKTSSETPIQPPKAAKPSGRTAGHRDKKEPGKQAPHARPPQKILGKIMSIFGKKKR